MERPYECLKTALELHKVAARGKGAVSLKNNNFTFKRQKDGSFDVLGRCNSKIVKEVAANSKQVEYRFHNLVNMASTQRRIKKAILRLCFKPLEEQLEHLGFDTSYVHFQIQEGPLFVEKSDGVKKRVLHSEDSLLGVSELHLSDADKRELKADNIHAIAVGNMRFLDKQRGIVVAEIYNNGLWARTPELAEKLRRLVLFTKKKPN
ncbi:MAG: hypothetical protein ACE5DI_03150 [Candidatus Micrarchaeia archaeon]